MASKGHGKPNTSMVGNVGDLYEDLDTGMVYRLASIVLKEKQMGFVTIPEYVCETNQYIWAPVAGVCSWNDLTDKPGGYITQHRELASLVDGGGMVYDTYDNRTLEFTEGRAWIEYPPVWPGFRDCESFVVIWDGVEYPSKQVSGNIVATDGVSPFKIGVSNTSQFAGLDVCAYDANGNLESGTTTHTFSIYAITDVIVPIDKKYLPVGHEFGVDKEEAVVASAVFTGFEWPDDSDRNRWSSSSYDDYSAILKYIMNYRDGATYTDSVTTTFGGSSYQTTMSWNGAEARLGDETLTDAVFYFYAHGSDGYALVETSLGSDGWELCIFGEVEVVTPIDEKYLPGPSPLVLHINAWNTPYTCDVPFEDVLAAFGKRPIVIMMDTGMVTHQYTDCVMYHGDTDADTYLSFNGDMHRYSVTGLSLELNG